MVHVYEFQHTQTGEYQHITLYVKAEEVHMAKPFQFVRSFTVPKVWGGSNGKLRWNRKQEKPHKVK